MLTERGRIARWSRAALLWGAVALTAGCHPGVVRPVAEPRGHLHALLLNGGGDAANNYQSHLSHIRSLLALLQPVTRPADIAIFSGDGADPAADLATREPAVEENFWLLPQSSIGRVLYPPTVYVNSAVDGFTLRPARLQALREWFEHEGARLRAGDTLLLYVTDHGELNKEDWTNNTITLWGESLSVAELRGLLSQLDSQVRVVLLMSQCFSGAFARAIYAAEKEFPPGNVCGYFAVTADRPAFGCYPENRGREGIGYSYEFFEALRQLGRFPEAHRRALVADPTPDVPFTTVDFWLEQRLHLAAQAQQREVPALVDEMLSEAWQNRAAWEPDIRLLDRIARTFGMFSPRSLAELGEQAQVLPDLSKQLALYAGRWREALEALQIDTVLRFVDADPPWRERLDPKQLVQLDAAGRRTTAASLLGELSRFARADDQRFTRLESLREKADATAATGYRTEVRVGAVLRLRIRLLNIAGRQYVAQHGTTEERETLQRLTACQELVLIDHPPVAAAASLPAPEPFPPLAEEQRFVQAAMPAWIGIQYRPLSESQQQQLHTSRGAAVVMVVYPDSPATAAGLQAGDIILGRRGQPFTEPHELREWIMRSEVGVPMRLQVLREGRPLRVTLRPGPFPVELPKLPGPPQVGSVAPPVTVDFVQGAASLTAKRPRLLFFWATWCTICHSSLPELLAFARANEIEIVAITDEDPATVRRFLAEFGQPFPAIVAVDPYRATFQRYGVGGTPTFVLIDGYGVVRQYQTGYVRAAGLQIEGWKWQGDPAVSE